MVSSIFYDGDGSTRIFPVGFKILGDNYVKVYIDDVEIVDKSKYDIINNSIVFNNDNIPEVGEDNVKIYVATSTNDLEALGASLTDITLVANNLDKLVEISETIVPNIDEVLEADTNASIATTKASEASTSATLASTKASEASTSATNANTALANTITARDDASESASNASTYEANALTYRNQASTYASNSSSSAIQASGYADDAKSAKTLAYNYSSNASTYANNANTSATTASTKASEASTSATNAEQSYQNVLAYAIQSEAYRDEALGYRNEANSAKTYAQSAQASAESARDTAVTKANEIQSYVIPAEATYTYSDIDSRIANMYSSSGYTTDTLHEDRWLETDTPNVIVDKVGDDYVIDGVVYEQLGDELVTNGDFSDGTLGHWLGDSGGVISLVNGKMKLTSNVNDTQINTYLPDAFIDTQANKTYLVSFYVNGVTNTTEIRLYLGGVLHKITDLSDGIKQAVITTSSTAELLFSLYSSVSNIKTAYFDNISVRELKQATLPLAPFASGTTDGLLDASIYGETTQQAYNKGDIVVKSSFEEVLSNTTNFITGFSFANNGDGTYTNTININNIYTPTYNGKYMLFKCTLLDESPFEFKFYFNTLAFQVVSSPERISTIDAIYVAENDVFTPYSTVVSEEIYQATRDTSAGALLTSSSFQTLDFITRQDLIYLTATGYKTKKGIHSFTDKELVEGGSDLIASRYGYSKLGDGLYEIDGEKVTGLQVSGSRLNAKAYHPIYNQLGIMYLNDETIDVPRNWYIDASVDVYSVYDVIFNTYNGSAYPGRNGSINGDGIISRPDSKFYDKIYIKGEGGLAPHSTFYARDSEFGSDRGLVGLSSGNGTYRFNKTGTGDIAYVFDSNYAVVYDYTASTEDNRYHFYQYDAPVGTYCYYIENGQLIILKHEGVYHTSGEIKWKTQFGATFANTGTIPQDNNNYVLGTFKHPQLLTYGESLTVDMIGDPANYPSEWKSYLAGGGVTSVNPHLVSDTGDNLIPDGTPKNIKVSNKALADYGTPRLTLSTGVWADSDRSTNKVTNSDTATWTTDHLALYNYTSYNTPYTQIDPTTITKVSPKVIASNSHSVYKGGLITQEATGKIPVGNGSNGYESRVLENAITTHRVIKPEESITLYVGDIAILGEGFADSGTIIKRINTDLVNYTYSAGATVSTGANYEIVSNIITIPQHSTISLDNSDSPSAKWFKAECEFSDGGKGECVFSQEMVWDYDLDNASEFTDNDGTTSQTYSSGTYYQILNMDTDILVYCVNDFTGIFNVLTILNNGSVVSDGGVTTYFKVWDGNGFGDDDTFEQLTNGTLTDLNGNIVQTKVLGRRY